VIGVGLRLVFNGGREAMTRLVVVAIAVGLGVGLLLTTLAATNAVAAWSSRHAWQWTGTAYVPAGPTAGVAPLWWHPSGDTFNGQQITRFDVAATGASSPVPPGIPRDPAPGQYYASPALVVLLRSTPADQLADRYPGRLAGTIGDAALPSPSSLVLIVGRTPAQLAATPDSVRVTSIASAEPVHTQDVVNPAGLQYSPPNGQILPSTSDLILSVVALAILAPVLIFITTATRLSAARREQRFAAMRLVGATRKQVSVLAGVESTVAAVLGAALGFGIFFLLRDPAASLSFIGEPFFPAELTLSLADILLVAIGVPAAAAVAARLALRRVHISPLGVARRTTPKPPRAWRLLPLLVGFADLGYFVINGKPVSAATQVKAFVPGYLLIIVGLVIAGPWLTMVAARVMARLARRPAALIAARRLADDPRAAFRAVSGLVLALLITTAAVVAIATQDSVNQTRFGTGTVVNMLTSQLADQQPTSGETVHIQTVNGKTVNAPNGTATTGAGPAASVAPLTARLRAIAGVQSVVVVRAVPGLSIPGTFQGLGEDGNGPATPVDAGAIACSQLATMPALGRCPAGAVAVAFPEQGFNGPLFGFWNLSGVVWPAAHVTVGRLDGLGVDAVNVGTDGSVPAVERARTVLENAYPDVSLNAPSTIGDLIEQDNATNNDYQQLANVVILVSLAIAGCTLAAGIAAGLADRKRPFSLLRLTGARLSTLRRVVALEGAVPLLAVAVVAIGTGFGGAAMNASLQQGHSIAPPGVGYYLITGGGILVALGIIAATFPLLARITGPEAARNE
jgi:hypothetical protein